LYGDVPLIRQSTLENLIVQAQKSGVALLSVMLDNPTGYGRIMRKDNQIQAIVVQLSYYSQAKHRPQSPH
jgi:bifunctional UDP-N-acetylglucosamine pyrophosphorylase/glucosamine-1-phosphate N-acetyltransferase